MQFRRSEGQAEQIRISEFIGVVARIPTPQVKINQYKIKIEYFNSRIPQTLPQGDRRRIGGGIDDMTGVKVEVTRVAEEKVPLEDSLPLTEQCMGSLML